MPKLKILNVVGARPNFMKIAPLDVEMRKNPDIEPYLLHTGQHYDHAMSELFFNQLGLPTPDRYLGVGSGSHGAQTGRIMIAFEETVREFQPDLVLVVGDVNSTIACGLVAVKMGVKLAHVEAGLRSFDRAMPEEINRVLTDQISDYLFITEASARDNLTREGIDQDRIFFVGNVMIDTLLGVPCVTTRDNTERPVTVEQGTNIVVGRDPKRLFDAACEILRSDRTITTCPELWDGRAAKRIVKILWEREGAARAASND
jgi:UDP-N-acetylglucosamine 2-epimerase (non-hydrolysing)